jgi:hypothetical protein
MYKILGALLALPFLAAPAAAQCCMPFARSYSGNVGFSLNLGYWANCMSGMPGGGPGGGGQPMPAQLGPWYQYWPLEAHYNAPAPTGYPYWPAAQTLPNGAGSIQTGGGPPDVKQSAYYFQPASYYGTPNYWYGR